MGSINENYITSFSPFALTLVNILTKVGESLFQNFRKERNWLKGEHVAEIEEIERMSMIAQNNKS